MRLFLYPPEIFHPPPNLPPFSSSFLLRAPESKTLLFFTVRALHPLPWNAGSYKWNWMVEGGRRRKIKFPYASIILAVTSLHLYILDLEYIYSISKLIHQSWNIEKRAFFPSLIRNVHWRQDALRSSWPQKKSILYSIEYNKFEYTTQLSQSTRWVTSDAVLKNLREWR